MKETSSRPTPLVRKRLSRQAVVFPPVDSHDLARSDQNQFASNEVEFEYNKPKYAPPEHAQHQYDEPEHAQPEHAQPEYAQSEHAQSEYDQPEYAVKQEESHSVLERSNEEPLENAAFDSAPEKELEWLADIQLADAIPPRGPIADDPMQDASRVVSSSYQVKQRAVTVAKRTRRFKAPRPINYRPKQSSLRAGEVSVLAGQGKAESLEDVDFDLPLDREDMRKSLADEEFSSPPRPQAGSGSKPDRRDDFESMEDNVPKNARIRSRLDNDLDGIDDLDNIDDEEPKIERPTDRPCNEFRDELLATSIRDISLDISPGAYSEASRYGGPSRSWTDRSGNEIASGTMVDLRRGYVILDSGQRIAYAKLGVSDLAAVSEFWRLPTVCLLGNRGGSPYRNWAPQTVTWKASSLCHKPLYFENRQLERYGHSRGPIAQPIHSTVHFFTSLVSLPYQTAITPPNECQYALGFFRPGGCAPWLRDPVPISLRGAGRQALLTTGAAFIP